MNYQTVQASIESAKADPWANGDGDYSRLVYRIVAFLRAQGLTVELYSPWLEAESVAGRISYENRTVWLNEPRAKSAALTAAHEAGHWVSYLRLHERYCREEDHMTGNAEILAYLYGWSVLRWLDTERLITKEMWREHHADILVRC